MTDYFDKLSGERVRRVLNVLLEAPLRGDPCGRCHTL